MRRLFFITQPQKFVVLAGADETGHVGGGGEERVRIRKLQPLSDAISLSPSYFATYGSPLPRWAAKTVSELWTSRLFRHIARANERAVSVSEAFADSPARPHGTPDCQHHHVTADAPLPKPHVTAATSPAARRTLTHPFALWPLHHEKKKTEASITFGLGGRGQHRAVCATQLGVTMMLLAAA